MSIAGTHMIYKGNNIVNAVESEVVDKTWDYYKDADNNIHIKEYSGNDADVVIPYEIDGAPVTVIGEDAFRNSEIKSIILPDTLTTIQRGAFSGCEQLTAITIPKNVTALGSGVFNSCESLKDITIESNTLAVCAGDFEETAWYDAQPEGVVYLDDKIVCGYKGTMPMGAEIKIKEGTISIAEQAFAQERLASVDMPDSVKTIGSAAFVECINLKSVHLSENLTTIEEQAFWSSGLTSITIPDKVTKIGANAFAQCHKLTEVNNNSIYADIGTDAFAKTPWYAEQPDGLIYLGKVAYKYKGLIPDNTEIKLREDTTMISGSAFSMNLEELDLSRAEQTTDKYKNLKSIIIPESVLHIGANAFENCQGITSIDLPEKLTAIESHLFYGCESLQTVNIPDGVKSIGREAFMGCTALTNVKLPDGLNNIELAAFMRCENLVSIEIPDSVTLIDDGAFSACTNLKTVTMPENVTLGKRVFDGVPNVEIIKIEVSQAEVSVKKETVGVSNDLTSQEGDRTNTSKQQTEKNTVIQNDNTPVIILIVLSAMTILIVILLLVKKIKR